MPPDFVHQRHQTPSRLARPREIVVVVPAMQSQVNLSRIVRAAGCFGIRQIVTCGSGRVDRRIARDGVDHVRIETHRSLPPVLRRLRQDGYRMVGLEQATHSQSLFAYPFTRRTALVIGHERQGIKAEELSLLDDVVEIPVYGMPPSHNAATSAAIAMYEYCRQFPDG